MLFVVVVLNGLVISVLGRVKNSRSRPSFSFLLVNLSSWTISALVLKTKFLFESNVLVMLCLSTLDIGEIDGLALHGTQSPLAFFKLWPLDDSPFGQQPVAYIKTIDTAICPFNLLASPAPQLTG